MKKIIKVVFTKSLLDDGYIKNKYVKKYIYVCDVPEIKKGDIITDITHTMAMQIVDIYDYIKYDDLLEEININSYRTYDEIANIIVDTINGEKVNNKKSNKMNNNKMFSGIKDKYMSQFLPTKEENVKLSMSGILCVPVGEEYRGIDKDNNLISFPEEMVMDIPIYSIAKASNQIQIGDIIKSGNTYSKVVNNKADGTLKVLSFSGITHNKKEVTDFILGQTTTRVLINMFNMDNTGFNPLLFAMSNKDMDMSTLMMLSMSPQGKSLFGQNNGGINPMMLMLIGNKEGDGDNDTLKTMMMMQMMNGNNSFGDMFKLPNNGEVNNVVKEDTPTPTKTTTGDSTSISIDSSQIAPPSKSDNDIELRMDEVENNSKELSDKMNKIDDKIDQLFNILSSYNK